jgi:hypothetical protein
MQNANAADPIIIRRFALITIAARIRSNLFALTTKVFDLGGRTELQCNADPQMS